MIRLSSYPPVLAEPGAAKSPPFSFPSLLERGAPIRIHSLCGPDALGIRAEGYLARGNGSTPSSARFSHSQFRAHRRGSVGLRSAITSLLDLGRVVLARAPFFRSFMMQSIEEKCGRWTIVVNRRAGYATINGDFHSGQFDRAELRSWIAHYRRMVAGPTGDFYVGTLKAHQRALELLLADEVAA